MYYLSWLKSKFLNERTAKLDEAQRNGYTSIGDLEGKFLLFENFCDLEFLFRVRN